MLASQLLTHGEDGWSNQGTRSQQEAEEQQVKRFLASVLQLMHEYAQFDPARRHYDERACRIAAGALPELLGYAAYQKDHMVGTGPLRIAIGNEQALGDCCRLQSWLPMEDVRVSLASYRSRVPLRSPLCTMC